MQWCCVGWGNGVEVYLKVGEELLMLLISGDSRNHHGGAVMIVAGLQECQ